jgi:hypothetical protein
MTNEMKRRITEEYKKTPVYTKVAKRLHIDARTVKKEVLKYDKASSVAETATTITDRDASSPAVARSVAAGATAKASELITKSGSPNGDDETSKKQSWITAAGSSNSSISGNNTAGTEIEKRLRTIYSAFNAGKYPNEIVADHGYDPDFVMEHYRRYNKMRGLDIERVQRAFLDTFDAAENTELRKYYNSFKEKGFLTEDEVMELGEEAVKLEAYERLKLILAHQSALLPDGWHRINCPKCKRTAAVSINPDAIVLCPSCFGKISR